MWKAWGRNLGLTFHSNDNIKSCMNWSYGCQAGPLNGSNGSAMREAERVAQWRQANDGYASELKRGVKPEEKYFAARLGSEEMSEAFYG
eukprot:scaffold75579_cov43-Prasinocladus_malaysianus.AAC.1